MDHHTNNCQILWELTPQHTARLLRIYDCTPSASVPDFIGGYPVTELGSYCFAKDCRLPQQYETYEASGGRSYAVTELSGNYIESVFLPDSLVKIHDYAFYNCRNLKQIRFGNHLTWIGSDAFMNCHQLQQLYIRCSVSDKTCLRQILAQISWDAEVSFYSGRQQDTDCIETSIFYPEYYETYDEIAPAHVFGRQIVGEGFRARQAFKDGIIDFTQYDEIFQKASAEESEQTMCRILLCRLRYPAGLSPDKKSQYENYVQAHGRFLSQWLVKNRQLESLMFLIQSQLLLLHDIQAACEYAAQSGWGEGNAAIMHWLGQYQKISQNTRYDFDSF